MKTLLVTGGAGFIGLALVRYVLEHTPHRVVNLDKLTYAGNVKALASAKGHERYTFEHLDICDAAGVGRVLAEHRPDAVLHLAAETHVDRSIDHPEVFVQTNIVGTFRLLEAVRHYWAELAPGAKAAFRFLHVSTDEVYGTLAGSELFTERTPYAPRSPYSASKAAADHLSAAYFHTYDLPVLITNCANNYGPYQYPEKLIPLVIARALAGEAVPVYGTGESVRDWLYVDDHVRGLLAVLAKGRPGETYNIGGHNEVRTLELVRTICGLLDEARPHRRPHASLIEFVADRPGHDLRYAIDASKMRDQLGWTPQETFATGLRKTVAWYLEQAS